jgi:SnoaL-like domain
VRGRPAALGRAARVEDLEAVVGALVERQVGVAEHHGVGALAEARAHPLQAPGARAGVVDHGDPRGARLHDALGWEQPAQLWDIDIPVDREQRRADRLELAQDLDRRDIASVQEQVGARDALDARTGEPSCAARQVRVRDDGDQHSQGYWRAVSEENVELVRAIIAAAPDWEAVRSMLNPEVRLDQTRMPDGGVYHGRDAFGRFFQRWFGTWDDLRLTPERFIEDHERVLVFLRVEARGKGSGVPVVTPRRGRVDRPRRQGRLARGLPGPLGGARGVRTVSRRGSRLTPPAPVAQWIERCPPEAEVAGSNPAGRVPGSPMADDRLLTSSERARLVEAPTGRFLAPSDLQLGPP